LDSEIKDAKVDKRKIWINLTSRLLKKHLFRGLEGDGKKTLRLILKRGLWG
jgi:hypothetical protein